MKHTHSRRKTGEWDSKRDNENEGNREPIGILWIKFHSHSYFRVNAYLYRVSAAPLCILFSIQSEIFPRMKCCVNTISVLSGHQREFMWMMNRHFHGLHCIPIITIKNNNNICYNLIGTAARAKLHLNEYKIVLVLFVNNFTLVLIWNRFVSHTNKDLLVFWWERAKRFFCNFFQFVVVVVISHWR